MQIVDTHQHLWDLELCSYAWTKNNAALNRSFRMSDYLAATAGCEVIKTVHMECDVDEPFLLQETQHLLRLAEQPDNPLTGVGPDTVRMVYPYYRDPKAVQQLNSHLHNVPLQIAAERGMPALAAWLAFIVMLLVDLSRLFRAGDQRLFAVLALAATVAMLAAGMFEYNFGDSEFLILFLILVTLPFAVTQNVEQQKDRLEPAPA